MTAAPALAPFRTRSFRFQWPADLTTSWAFEMETLILGWLIMVETGSVFMLTLFAALQQVGTLLAPMFGVIGDRVGHRNLLLAMRLVYAAVAVLLMTLAFLALLTPTWVLLIVGTVGLLKPSDTGVRAALLGETIPPAHMVAAASIQRTTMDSARVAGALAGAGLAAALGTGWAYAVVACFYLASAGLTARAGRGAVARPIRVAGSARSSPWRDLGAGLGYVWRTPHLRATMTLALLLNMTVYPMMIGLLPYVAKEVHLGDRTWLAYLVACASAGGLAGAIVMSRRGGTFRPARAMIVFSLAWYAMMMLFAWWPDPATSLFIIAAAGFAQALGQIPMATLLLRTSDPAMRGRVMGIRMLAIYGHVPGLLFAGPVIAVLGFPAAATLSCGLGIGATLVIAGAWRRHLWRDAAAANAR